MANKQELVSRLIPFGQQHLLAFWDQLDHARRETLARQIAAIDFAQLDRLFRQGEEHEAIRGLADRAESPPSIRPGDVGGEGHVFCLARCSRREQTLKLIPTGVE